MCIPESTEGICSHSHQPGFRICIKFCCRKRLSHQNVPPFHINNSVGSYPKNPFLQTALLPKRPKRQLNHKVEDLKGDTPSGENVLHLLVLTRAQLAPPYCPHLASGPSVVTLILVTDSSHCYNNMLWLDLSINPQDETQTWYYKYIQKPLAGEFTYLRGEPTTAHTWTYYQTSKFLPPRPHWRSFLVQWMLGNAETHNWSKCREYQ